MCKHKAEASKCRRHSSRKQVETGDLERKKVGQEALKQEVQVWRPSQAMEFGNKGRPGVSHQSFPKWKSEYEAYKMSSNTSRATTLEEGQAE